MSDLHGNFLPYDHLNRRPAVGGLPYVYSFVREQRQDTTQHVIFLNAGDILQGSMAAYYYNYLDEREQKMPIQRKCAQAAEPRHGCSKISTK